MSFKVMKDELLQCEVELQVLGDHMVENAVGIIAMLATRGIADPKAVAHALYAFRGVKRRLERISRRESTPVYNDFGSSQSKLQAGIDAMRRAYPDRRLTVIFEPHTFSFRNRAALEWYKELFREAHRVIVLPPPTHGATTHDQLTWEEITNAIERPNLETVPLDTWAGLRREIAVWSDKRQDVLLLESSGDFYGLWPELEAWAANK
jgi:UDP-N-acetylmuramate: L-alanyl-gamma-D-glutamyl-meso-diaminopimelate ligase